MQTFYLFVTHHAKRGLSNIILEYKSIVGATPKEGLAALA